jgi:hypothetical protein
VEKVQLKIINGGRFEFSKASARKAENRYEFEFNEETAAPCFSDALTPLRPDPKHSSFV